MNNMNPLFYRQRTGSRTLTIILAVIGGLTIVAGLVYLIWRLSGRFMDDYDLYDDLDNYYEEDEDGTVKSVDGAEELKFGDEAAEEADFAE